MTQGFRLPALALLLALGACSTNPATGRQSFTGFLSEGGETEIGREQHDEVLKAFGGAYEDAALQRYVDGIGQLLAATSERRNLRYRFTLLDSPVVNAFALPGGYVYVTRGLLALAGNEAELAGVIAHEIGHVSARHAAERYSQAMLANIGLMGVGIVAGGGVLADALGTGAAAYLQGYSRDQEYEADLLGVRYLARAGYEPKAMSSFLAKLEAHDRLQAALAGEGGGDEPWGIMASHPRTADRVGRAIAAAGDSAIARPMTEEATYLGKIDGLAYGDSPEDGYVRGRRFLHPGLGIGFEVPPGFTLVNTPERVQAQGPGGSVIVLDRAPKPAAGDMATYLTRNWGRNLSLVGVESLEVNGYEAATGYTTLRDRDGRYDLRLVALRFDDGTIYRFIFATPEPLTRSLAVDLRRATYSFHRLTDEERTGLRPQRIAVVVAAPGDTVASLAARMPFADWREERFRVLNGLGASQRLVSGRLVKLVVE